MTVIDYHPSAERGKSLRNVFARPYEWVFKRNDRPVNVSVAGQITVTMPARFAGYDWEHYQPESVRAVLRWARQNPTGVLLDIGRTGGVDIGHGVGIYSLIVLTASPHTEAVVFDSALPRLAEARQLCAYVEDNRLSAVYGFIGDPGRESMPLSDAIARTNTHFRAAAAWGGLGMRRYASPFGPPGSFRSPDDLLLCDDLLSIDELSLSQAFANRPILIRSHEHVLQLVVVERAEYLIWKTEPVFLLTIDPQARDMFGNVRANLRRGLECRGYEVSCLEAESEEQWWCQKPASSRNS
jgi:hypothetical protein